MAHVASPEEDEEPPPPAATAPPAALLDLWLDHLEALTLWRLRQEVGETGPDQCPSPPPVPNGCDESPFARFAAAEALSSEDSLLLAIALSPWVRPDLIDRCVAHCRAEGGNFEALGGVRGKQHRAVLPTGDTALFLLAGPGTAERLDWQRALLGESPLIRRGILRLEPPPEGEPPMAGRLIPDRETAERALYGAARPPQMSAAFPARRLETGLGWEDLVLPASTRARIDELVGWVGHRRTLMEGWGMRRKLRPGCRALFFGPPGTGKTLTASLLGKRTGHPVYRVDLSMVVSKYIGETEKNLAALLDNAEHKDWILFFDEADALFGKRAQVRDARDRYANQEVSYLLQRIELFDGLAILASNFTNNVDAAFSRRFEHVIHFPLPKTRERLALWRGALPDGVRLEPGLDLGEIASQFEVSGGTIVNVVRHACLKSILRDERMLRRADLEEGVRREYAKENRLQ